ERHKVGEAIVIPVILRPSEGWTGAPFGKLNAVPTDGRPVTLAPDRDQAFVEVARAIREAATHLARKRPVPKRTVPFEGGGAGRQSFQEVSLGGSLAPRSSNLRLAKTFSDRDRDHFRLESFEYIARCFETSLTELEVRNSGIEGTFRRIDANRFTASIYRTGRSLARCTIFISSMLGDGIAFVCGETDSTTSLNENLSVGADDQSM